MAEGRPQPVLPLSQLWFFAAILVSTFLMGSSFIAAKILIRQGFSPMPLVGWRFLVAALATFPLVLLEKNRRRGGLWSIHIGYRDIALVALIGLVQTACVMGLLFWAMQFISAATAAILLFTNPIWVAVMGRIFLRESLYRGRMIGLCLGIIGVVFAIGLGSGGTESGVTWHGKAIGIASALGAAFCWATATIINKRARLLVGPWALNFGQMLIGAIALLGLAYGTRAHWPGIVTWQQYGWFLWLAIPASTGSFGLWFVALNKGGATRTSSFLFLTPLFTVILAYFIMGRTLSWPQAMGGILIGLALWLVNTGASAQNQQGNNVK